MVLACNETRIKRWFLLQVDTAVASLTNNSSDVSNMLGKAPLPPPRGNRYLRLQHGALPLQI